MELITFLTESWLGVKRLLTIVAKNNSVNGIKLPLTHFIVSGWRVYAFVFYSFYKLLIFLNSSSCFGFNFLNQ